LIFKSQIKISKKKMLK